MPARRNWSMAFVTPGVATWSMVARRSRPRFAVRPIARLPGLSALKREWILEREPDLYNFVPARITF